MTPDRWKQIEKLISGALKLDPSQWSSFLQQACQDDSDLQNEVRAYLTKEIKTLDIFKEKIPHEILRNLIDEPLDSLAGQQVEQFKVIRRIGEGGVGKVYLGHDLTLNRPVVLKFLLKKHIYNKEFIRRFELEAKTASSLNHPHIVTIYALAKREDEPYIVMEYVEGNSLRQYLAELGLKPYQIKLKEALSISRQVASALAFAHDHGIIHRDIKPENIMLPAGDDKPVKVLDFGIAKVILNITPKDLISSDKAEEKDNQTSSGTLLGTVNYMSPEQVSALDTVNFQTDLWSLGVVLYEMLTGRRPFEGRNHWEVIASIHSKEPLPLANFIRDAPNELQQILNKALAKKRSERYQKASELQADLERLFYSLKSDNQAIIQASDSFFSVGNARQSNLWTPYWGFRRESSPGIPDLLTPGMSQSQMINYLTPQVGRELAKRFLELSETSIVAVESGDFELHVVTGKQIEEEAQGFPEIEAAGRYFAAEGYRLKADLEKDHSLKKKLLQAAAEYYELSLEKNPQGARAIRGLGRVNEVQGDYEIASQRFKQAEGLAQFQISSGDQPNLDLHLSHEILRITRHYIHCILDITATNPQSAWHRENKRRELEGYLISSENLHRENMPRFKARPEWSRIEWFMGLVFFGKAWGQLGNQQRKTACLIDALKVRRKMMSSNPTLTAIEKANILWWVSVALSEPYDIALTKAESLAQAINQSSASEVLRIIDDILFPFTSPWEEGIS